MLDYTRTAGGRQQSGAGGQIETAGAVAARAHGIHGRQIRWHLRVNHQLPHGHCEAADFFGGFSFRAQCGKQRARERRIQLAAGECAHQLTRLGLGKRMTIEQAIQHVREDLAHQDVVFMIFTVI